MVSALSVAGSKNNNLFLTFTKQKMASYFPAGGIFQGSSFPNANLTTALSESQGGTNQTTYTTGDLLYSSATNTLAKRSIGSTGQIMSVSGGLPVWSTPSSGTVTSVGLSAPSIFSVSGSPVASSGTLTFSSNTQSANSVYTGPSSGGAAVPTFRALVDDDIPNVLSLTELTVTGNATVGDLSVERDSVLCGEVLMKGNVEIEQTLTVGKICASPIAVEAWMQVGSDIDGEAANDASGFSVAMSTDGNTVVIGAEYNDGNGTYSGHVRVYDWSGSAWLKRGLDIDGEAAGDRSGSSVAMSSDGNTVAIGAIQNDGNGYDSGHVRVYDWSGGAWVQRGSDIDGSAPDDLNGYSVALSSDGNTVATGAYYNDGNGTTSGQARIFKWSGSAWVQLGSDIYGEGPGAYSAGSVSLSSSGNTIAIGSFLGDSASNLGNTRVYDWYGSVWVQRGLDINGEAFGDYSYSVDLSADGNTVAIGAIGNDNNGSNSGQARIFDWSGSAWVQRGLDINGEAALDNSGTNVAISSDGNTIAIGAPNNDGNGSKSGHTRVYDWSGGMWVQRGSDIDGEAAGDQSGYSVAMSSDGNIVAIGAPYNNGNGYSSGQTRVYRWPTTRIDMCSATVSSVEKITANAICVTDLSVSGTVTVQDKITAQTLCVQGAFSGGFAQLSGSDSGVTLPNDRTVVAVLPGTASGAFALSAPTQKLVGQVMHVHNNSGFATTGIAIASGSGATLICDGTTWVRL